jgi:hypothetical protein
MVIIPMMTTTKRWFLSVQFGAVQWYMCEQYFITRSNMIDDKRGQSPFSWRTSKSNKIYMLPSAITYRLPLVDEQQRPSLR